MRKVLITGIGGNVGQGILRNIIHLDYDIFLVGTNTTAVSAGNHLCDVVYQVPFSTNKNYLKSILEICEKEKVELIIPSTDFEAYYLSLSHEKLPLLASSGLNETELFLNKYLTWKEFSKCNIPFAMSVLPSEYNNDFKELIVKPTKGRGSREVYINPKDVKLFSDEFIVQELYKGKEITTTFYVKKNGELHGFITFERELENGMTTKCEVIDEYDKEIKKIILAMIKNFSIRGSCNIQSIVTNTKKIVPFEVNCRISGTNSIRSQFGFEDVKYILQEYLFGQEPDKPMIKKGSALRIMMDVIYPDISLSKIENIKTKHYIY